jgi:hypothetical protein
MQRHKIHYFDELFFVTFMGSYSGRAGELCKDTQMKESHNQGNQ